MSRLDRASLNVDESVCARQILNGSGWSKNYPAETMHWLNELRSKINNTSLVTKDNIFFYVGKIFNLNEDELIRIRKDILIDGYLDPSNFKMCGIANSGKIENMLCDIQTRLSELRKARK